MLSSLARSVAYVVQTVPLFPTSCCTADTGPTVQMAIHQHPDYPGKLSEDDIARLSLFMFTVTPNVPGAPGGGSGGPMNIMGKFSNLLLAKTGWALGFGMTEVETEYLSFKQVSLFYPRMPRGYLVPSCLHSKNIFCNPAVTVLASQLQVFNGEIAGIGDFLEVLRGKKKAVQAPVETVEAPVETVETETVQTL